MADLAGIGSIISGIGGIGIGIANSFSNAEINKKNYELQKDWQNYQKQLQREIFQREDSAIQRRASDIAAAGGNPAMAWETGNGAGAGSIVDTSAPQQSPYDYSQLMNSSLAMFAGGLKQFQEARLIDAQINYNILNIVVNTELMRIYSPAPKHYNILNIIINTDYYL